MSLDAQPIRLTKRGRIVIEPDGSIRVSDFKGENCTCREVCVLALGWAIQHLAAEMVKDIEAPGGSNLVGVATVSAWATEPSGETLAQRESVCAAWADLPDDLRKDRRLTRLYRALGGPRMEYPGEARGAKEDDRG